MSGLVDVPQVSQYRLTAHLGLALLIFACMVWFAMDFLRGQRLHRRATNGYLKITGFTVFIVFVMMLNGGFVAGTDAGFIMNTFPTMNGSWVPVEWLAMSPGWRNFFENPVAIQFLHRCIAIFVVLTVLVSYQLARHQKFITHAGYVLVIMVLQVVLGISALLLVVPVALGAAHQAGAVAFLASSLYTAHCARKGL